MEHRDPIDLGYNIQLVDGFDLGFPSRTGSYIFDEEVLTIIETGPSRSVPHIIKGLETIGRTLEEVQYIIVTHIHLDHAGGAGLLLKDCLNAKVVVHPRGLRHLIDPERLIAGAKAVYRDAFEELFAPILPIPEERLMVMSDGDTLQIGRDRILQFLDTPGHAKHHFSIYDSFSKGVFTGDTIGVRYDGLSEFGGDIYLPSTSPNQFDPNDMLQSIDKLKKLDLERIYFGHFGVSSEPEIVFEDVSEWLMRFMEVGQRVFEEENNPFKLASALNNMVKEAVSRTRSIPQNHDFYKILSLDMQVCAMGIMDYLNRQQSAR
jgi:glyoxylase-like metal-dependent hydrolase (beta-lactamase superfamily II)